MTAGVAERGLKFVVTTDVASDIAKPFQLVEAHVAALEKRLKGLTIPAPKIAGANGNGANGVGTNGNGASSGHAGAANADKLARDRERAAERAFRTEAKWNRMAEAAVEKRSKAEEAAAKRAADVEKREIDRITKERQKALDEQTKADKKFWDEAIQQAKAGAKARADAIAAAAREDATGWRRLSAMGRDSFIGGRKVAAGYEALSDMGRAAMPRDPFAEGLRRMADERAARTGFAGLGLAGAEAAQQLESIRAIRAEDEKKAAAARKAAKAEENRAIGEAKERQAQLREGINATIDSVSKLARGFTQLGLIGETDMHRIANAMLGVQGTIDTVRGTLDGFRNFQGFMGVGGAGSGLIRKLGPAAALSGGTFSKEAAHLLKGLGIRSFGVAGGLGLVGAGVGAAALGTAGLMGAMIDRRRGVAGNVGGFWDTIGRGINAPVGFVNRGLMGIGSKIEASFNEPYGLTDLQSKERSLRLHKEQFERDFSAEQGKNESYYAAKKRADIAEEEAQLMELRRKVKVERQAQMDASHLAGSEQEFGAAHTALEFQQQARERNLMLRENYSPLTSEGPLFSSLRRRRGAIGEQIAGVRYIQERLAAERSRAFQEGGLQKGSLFDARTADQLVEYEKQIRDLMGEQAAINREIHKTAIDGLKQQLELRKQMAAGARNRFEGAFAARQGLQERLGLMTPSQVRAIADAKRIAEGGGQLSRHQIENLLQNGDERGQFLARQQARQRFRNLPEELRGTLGDVEERKFQGTQASMGAAAEGRDQLNRDIISQEQLAGIARPPPVMVDAKYTNEIKVELSAALRNQGDLENELSNALMPKIETAFQENVDRFADMIMKSVEAKMNEKIRRMNQQGRQGAGG